MYVAVARCSEMVVFLATAKTVESRESKTPNPGKYISGSGAGRNSVEITRDRALKTASHGQVGLREESSSSIGRQVAAKNPGLPEGSKGEKEAQ